MRKMRPRILTFHISHEQRIETMGLGRGSVGKCAPQNPHKKHQAWAGEMAHGETASCASERA